MGLTIGKKDKLPLASVAGRFGINATASVRGLSVPISEDACYVSLTQERWKYWVRATSDAGAENFGARVGGLIPLNPQAFMARLNDHATGPVQPSFWKRPSGEAIIFDLPDPDVLERFALACAAGEALAAGGQVFFTRAGHSETKALVIQDALPNLNTNVSLWAVDAPTMSLVFFPNALLLRRDRHQFVVPYAEVAVRRDPTPEFEDTNTLRLAISDQRVRLHVRDPDAARRALKALEGLIAFEAKRGEHLGPKPSERRRRISSASCGRIVIKPKADDDPAASDRVVIKVKLGADAERPAPDPDDGLQTPGVDEAEYPGEADAGLVFCDDSGLTFAIESPLADDEHEGPSSDSDLGIVLSDEAPTTPDPFDAEAPTGPDAQRPRRRAAEQPPPARRRPPRLDRVRAAVGALLSYVAKTDAGFTESERQVIREELQLPRAFPLDKSYSAVRPNSKALQRALSVLKNRPVGLRKRVLAACEHVANADGTVTVEEKERLVELKDALNV